MNTPAYIKPLIAAYQNSANKANAVQMKKYMKDKFEFYGIKSPQRKEIYREHKNNYGLIPYEQLEGIVKWCWQQPQREYQYFAMEFLGRMSRIAKEDIIDLYIFMIINKSWWDTVDYLAANLVGSYFNRYPDRILSFTNEWMASENMWLQRTCLLFQLKYKSATDTKLLDKFIVPLSGSKEFFIRKAIGWVLREYSKTDSQFVKDYVKKTTLSGLSHREAMKWLISRNK